MNGSYSYDVDELRDLKLDQYVLCELCGSLKFVSSLRSTYLHN